MLTPARAGPGGVRSQEFHPGLPGSITGSQIRVPATSAGAELGFEPRSWDVARCYYMHRLNRHLNPKAKLLGSDSQAKLDSSKINTQMSGNSRTCLARPGPETVDHGHSMQTLPLPFPGLPLPTQSK